MKRTFNFTDVLNFKKRRSEARLVILKTKKEYWMSFCHSINDKTNFCKAWSVIKSMLGSSTWSLIHTIKCNNQIYTKGKDIANAFARNFASTSSNTNYEEQS